MGRVCTSQVCRGAGCVYGAKGRWCHRRHVNAERASTQMVVAGITGSVAAPCAATSRYASTYATNHECVPNHPRSAPVLFKNI